MKPLRSSSSSRCSKKRMSSLLGRRLRMAARPARRAASRRRLEPFIADQQHRLRQVERGEGRIERHAQHRVGERDVLVHKPGALRPEQDAAGLARGDEARGSRRRPRAASRCASPCSGRAPSWHRRAADRRSPPRPCRRAAPCRARCRRRSPPPAPCRWASRRAAATRRRSVRPQLNMARAAVPIFSPSCGSTRMMAGPPLAASAAVIGAGHRLAAAGPSARACRSGCRAARCRRRR